MFTLGECSKGPFFIVLWCTLGASFQIRSEIFVGFETIFATALFDKFRQKIHATDSSVCQTTVFDSLL